jgi:hypothetical protein
MSLFGYDEALPASKSIGKNGKTLLTRKEEAVMKRISCPADTFVSPNSFCVKHHAFQKRERGQ